MPLHSLSTTIIMHETHTPISVSQRFVKLLLWCLRRPLPLWFVLLFGIWTFVTPIVYLSFNWHDVAYYYGAAKLVELLAAPVTCISACVLAFCLRKESIAFLLIYFVIYAINLFQFPLDGPTIRAGAAIQVFLGVTTLCYLLVLRKAGRLC